MCMRLYTSVLVFVHVRLYAAPRVASEPASDLGGRPSVRRSAGDLLVCAHLQHVHVYTCTCTCVYQLAIMYLRMSVSRARCRGPVSSAMNWGKPVLACIFTALAVRSHSSQHCILHMPHILL